MHKLAIYDLDRTITRHPTYFPFLLFALRRLNPWRIAFVPAALVAALPYALKRIGRGRLKEINFRLFIGRKVHPERMGGAVSGFADWNLARNTLKGALERIDADRAEGYRIVIATASFHFYVREYAKLIGVEDVIGTSSHIADERISGRLDGDNCYGDAKLRMVQAWLANEGIAREDCHIRFYSDSATDAPCMDWADEAFATSPHKKLRRLAAQRQWPILDWKKQR